MIRGSPRLVVIEAFRIPTWLPLLIVGIQCLAFWAILTLASRVVLLSIPAEIRSIVQALSTIGNLVGSLVVLAAWPILALLFYASATLIAGADPPDLGNFVRAMGVAQAPMAVGMLLALALLAQAEIDLPDEVLQSGGESIRRHLESIPVFHHTKAIMSFCYALNLLACIFVVKTLFKSSWPRSSASVLLPILVYCFLRVFASSW